jgi:hypothetical protein
MKCILGLEVLALSPFKVVDVERPRGQYLVTDAGEEDPAVAL